ncbi:hypothetical protein [Pseudobacteriovorax antillogorgiicola]|uniref:MetA-pathway of phenol degradation n=1 Tax=Pseudobacteriovorax antillogorgiicola TaxID=1513793 RepID=A0A1Y6BMV6_9BACT|nr:hypothetical protein [Pseudobacteriovorax antillogorgiicola]TCS53928.1 hypothetical protein EDD56_107240 [Pseudobacteriovorax antillogorgiicola]SMF20485.1 hypothetical protein SAMN06296036_10732 [Pseudobacteriovorax antillogorgiicola]
MSNRLPLVVLLAASIIGPGKAFASAPSTTENPGYVQDFTAYTLPSGAIKLGFAAEYGVSETIDVGLDTLALAAGAPNLKMKYQVWSRGLHSVSIGASVSYLNRDTALWGFVKDHFDELDAQIVRPQISWSQRMSPRLTLHSHWSIGLGDVNASLSEEGRKYFWESKYPQGDYETRTQDVSDETNTEANLGLAHRTLQAQSLMGLSRDFFQISGEFHRDESKRILLSSRISNLQLESLKSQDFRVTAAQEWRHGAFNFRLGLGILYQVLSGADLDGESVDDAGFLPIGDFDIYWIF